MANDLRVSVFEYALKDISDNKTIRDRAVKHCIKNGHYEMQCGKFFLDDLYCISMLDIYNVERSILEHGRA
jgi:hypothetical protein